MSVSKELISLCESLRDRSNRVKHLREIFVAGSKKHRHISERLLLEFSGLEQKRISSKVDPESGVIFAKEVWTLGGDNPIEIESVYNPDNVYIGDKASFERYWNKWGLRSFEPASQDDKVCSIGFNPEEKKWYGWSHRAYYGFGIGDKGKESYPEGDRIDGDEAKTLDDAKQLAIDFARSVS